MRRLALFVALSLATPGYANDWEKYYHSMGNIDRTIPSTVDPELIASCGDTQKDAEALFRRGFAPIGFTEFQTANNKTEDTMRWAKKLQARYVVVCVNMSSSQTVSMPITLPETTTSTSSGNVNAFGSGGAISGTYSGTTTTFGSQTTYIPMTINRFNKGAMYFREMPKHGLGIYPRSITDDEMISLGTRHGVAVRFVRDGSPADAADILPGDIILQVNGVPIDSDSLSAAEKGVQPFTLHLIRAGQPHDVSVTVPPEWRPN